MNLYEKFIELDDKKIVKIIRKVFVIYAFSMRKIILNKFLKWRLVAEKLKNNAEKFKLSTNDNILKQTISSNLNNSNILIESNEFPSTGIYKKKKVMTPSEPKQKINTSEINNKQDINDKLITNSSLSTITNRKSSLPREKNVKLNNKVEKVEDFSISKKELEVHDRLFKVNIIF